MSLKKRLLWNGVFQYANVLLTFVQGVFLLPVYLHYISSEQYGLWLMISGVVMWTTLFDPGLSALYQKKTAAANSANHHALAKSLTIEGLKISAGISAAIIGITYGFIHPICVWISNTLAITSIQVPELQTILLISIAAAAISIVASYASTVGIGLGAEKGHAVGVTVGIIAGIVSSMILLNANYAVTSLAVGILLRSLFQAVISIALLHRQLGRIGRTETANSEVVRNSTLEPLGDATQKVLLWSICERISGTLCLTADVLIIGKIANANVVSHYGIAKRPIDMFCTISQKAAAACTPELLSLVGSKNKEKLANIIEKLVTGVIWGTGLMAIVLSCFYPKMIDIWVGSSLYIGNEIVFVLIVFFVINNITATLAGIYWACADPIAFYKINTLLNVATVLLALILASYWGVLGVIAGLIIPKVLISLWYFPSSAFNAISLPGVIKSKLYRQARDMFFSLVLGLIILVSLGGFLPREPQWCTSVFSLVIYLSAMAVASVIYNKHEIRKPN